MRYRLGSLFAVIAGIGVALAIGRTIGLTASLMILAISGFVVPAVVGNFWMRAALAVGLTGLPIGFVQPVANWAGEVEGTMSLGEILILAVPKVLVIGMGAFMVSTRFRWLWFHSQRSSLSFKSSQLEQPKE